MRFLRISSRGWGRIVLLAGVGAFALTGTGNAYASVPAEQKDAGVAAIKRVAIVIDDFGNGMKGTDQMLGLPVRLTTAIMPFLPTTHQDAEAAHAKGHDVIVHLPMEPVRGKASWLGPKAILTSLPDDEIRRRVEAAIADVPYAVGMNNHMGSKATADERVMRIVLQVCKEKGLFFLDSRTSYKTVVPKVAKEVGVSLLQNDLFLDDVYTMHHVSKQLRLLKEELAKKDSCVAIGHVGPSGLVTSGTLRSVIPKWEGEVRFVGVSELLSAP
ncbi:divergent polysaccharide deacetylase family protein [Cohnella zeiphila]|uniref:Divergent polysaccharide deacetylase family protein n=1 Tax=Cohnella zeiphila TaxID=2761120 RepID=A0A7X0SGG6_9BACL|nr:divergent polysaccharide deacetylase family protein [Cohnella zeiphila]MBB6729529.1 divergent polysaccharide deacetylase family protein [Cohnella zeiphila]